MKVDEINCISRRTYRDRIATSLCPGPGCSLTCYDGSAAISTSFLRILASLAGRSEDERKKGKCFALVGPRMPLSREKAASEVMGPHHRGQKINGCFTFSKEMVSLLTFSRSFNPRSLFLASFFSGF